MRLTQLFNLTGHPAISLPCGDTPEAICPRAATVGDGIRPRAGGVALRCEAEVTTCTFIFRSPVKIDSIRLTALTMRFTEKRRPETFDVKTQAQQSRYPPRHNSMSAR